MNWLNLVKLVLAVGCLWYAFRLGEDHVNAKDEKTHITQLKAVVTALDAQAAARVAAEKKIEDVQNAYDAVKDLPPLTLGLAERVLYQPASACSNPVPSPSAVAGVAQAAGAVPASDPEAVRLLQAAFDAGSADALQLDTAIKLAP